jgi:hypothetical protein
MTTSSGRGVISAFDARDGELEGIRQLAMAAYRNTIRG